MRNLNTVDLAEARKIIKIVTDVARNDGGEPVVVAVAGADGNTVSLDCMDGAMPASIAVAMNKAYTAVMAKRDTIVFQNGGTDAANFTDPRMTSFAGGVLLKDAHGNIIGSVAVSGRKGARTEDMEHDIRQDHELAQQGATYFPTNI
jgi:uncharacterized protein GlcG (DUF336 family)